MPLEFNTTPQTEDPSYLESAWGLAAGSLVAAAKDVGDSIGIVGEKLGVTSAYERTDTREVIAEYAGDSAAAFYDRNPHLVEGVGLAIGTLAPGGVGVKALRAAQAAEKSLIGGMLRLPASTLKASRDAAQEAMLVSDNVYGALNGNVVKALVAGAGANVLDMAAFEVAATAATFASPIYNDFTAGDYAKNAIVNIAFGGAVGTAFSSAKTFYGVGTAARKADAMTAPLREVKVGAAEQTPWVNLTGLLEQLDDGAATISARNLGATDAMIAAATPARKAAIRTEIHKEVSRISADSDVATGFTKLITNPTTDGVIPDAMSMTGLAKEVRRGTLAADTEEVGRTFDLHTGESFAAGITPVKHIGDELSAGHSVALQGDNLLTIGADKTVRTIKIGKDFTQLGEIEAQAAWLHARTSKGIELEVRAGDLPRMEKLLDVSDDVLAKTPANIGGKLYRNSQEVQTAVFESKVAQLESLSDKLLPEQLMTRLNVTKAFLDEPRFATMVAKQGEEHVNFLRNPRNVTVIYDLPKVTSAVEPFIAPRKIEGAVDASMSAASFVREAGNKEVRPLTIKAIHRKFAEGGRVEAAKITVRKDGTIALDGNKRVTALSKMMEDIKADTDHVPVKVIVEDGATIPTHFASGEPFPVVRKPDGKIIPNPLVDQTSIRLQRAYSEESLRIENMNKQHSLERELTATALHPDMAVMPSEQLGLELFKFSTRTDKGQGFLINAEAITGGLGAFTQQVGQLTSKLRKSVHETTDGKLNPHIYKARNDPTFKVGAEMITISNFLRGTKSDYVLARDAAGNVLPMLQREDLAIMQRLSAEKQAIQAKWDAASQAGSLTPAQIKQFRTEMSAASRVIPAGEGAGVASIPISEDALQLLQASTEVNSGRLAISTKVHSTTGHPSLTLAQQYGLERVYLPPVNTKKYPHFVFVRQTDGITQTSHTSVMTAASPEALATKVKQLQRDYPGMEFVGSPKSNYEFFYKKDVESYHKASGDYEYARGMNDNPIDSALRSKRMMYEENPPIDKQHANEWFNDFEDWHRRMDDKSVRDVVELKYGQLFRQLEIMGSNYTKVGTSFFGSSTSSAAAYAAQTVHNPYGDLVKQALDISKTLEYPMWLKANEFANNAWAKASLTVRKGGLAMLEQVNPRDLEVEAARLNEMTDKMGIGNPYQAEMLKAYRDALPLNPSLSSTIAKGNAALNFLVLGSDMLQAFNTLIGTTVHATEFTALRTAILKKNAASAGKLTELSAGELPNSIEMLAQSAKEYFTGGKVWSVEKGAWEEWTGKQIMDEYIRNGLRIGDAKALADAMDHFAYNPKISAEAFSKSVEAGMETVRKYTGNTPADAISRFMAARSMHILTDRALSKGLLASKQEAAIYINQHVTRVHGATVASQRPIIFSGPIGQSVSVFMTFYTNFLQRMFQHAGSGDKTALMTMGAMQVGLYGLQGLPAFNFINTHLVGTAAGNKGHQDLYTLAGGSEEAKWLMFGAGSSLLGLVHPDLEVNLYSRGDLNPRQASIIPLMPQDTALYGAVSKTVGNLWKLGEHIAGGAGMSNSLAFAMEHNGVNRPISGIGALLSGGMTTNKGALISEYGNPDISMFAIMARVAGGKPLDDATAADALYRQQAYKANTAAKIAAVGENMRVAMQKGEQPDVLGFMREYTHAGGDIANFNRFMKKQFVTATNPQIDKAAEDLGSVEGVGVSRLLGGGFVAEELQ